jgi:uncharacterized protein YceK
LLKLQAVPVLAICAFCVMSGCSTVSNLSDERVPYGGVQKDAKYGVDQWEAWCHPSGHCIQPATNLMLAVYILGIDLPLCIVGDTLTLPLTIPTALKQKERTPEDHDWRHGYNLSETKNVPFDYIHGSVE